MASIAGYNIIKWDGPFQLMGEEITDSQRPGVHGSDFIATGRRGKPFTRIADIDCTNPTTLLTAKVLLKNLQGTYVTVVDNIGNTYLLAFMVKEVEFLSEERFRVATGGNNNGEYYLKVQFTLHPTLAL